MTGRSGWIGSSKRQAALLTAAIGWLLLPAPVTAQASAGNERVSYTFQRGDTLAELANKYLRRRGDYRIVQRINRIADPRRIPVGKTIRIPFRLLKYRQSTASLSAFRGNVSIAADGRALRPVAGMAIGEGSRLVTAASSFLTLELEDGSRISMPSNSVVRLRRLRHILLTDSIDYELGVESGRIRSKITPFDRKADRYRVRTPVAVSAVRGTDYRTRVEPASGRAFSETVEGLVEVAAGDDLAADAVTAVPAGTGVAASPAGDLATATLLTPPELIDPAKVQSEEQLAFELGARDAAVAHQILVSTDAGFVDIVAEQRAESNLVTLPGLDNGRYFAKATAFDADGFQGMPATYAFRRQLSTLSGSADSGDFGYRFKWTGRGDGKRAYRFQLLRGAKTGIPIVDEAGLTSNVITLSDLPDGEYFWRVGVTQFSEDPEDGEVFQKWTDFEKLTVAG